MKRVWVPLALEYEIDENGKHHITGASIVKASSDPYAGFWVEVDDETYNKIAGPLSVSVSATAPEPVKRSCNRHNDCDAAEDEVLARNPGSTKMAIHPSFHCHDDCCEDCFGQ